MGCFVSVDMSHVRIWMRDNQAGRRNVNAAWRIELELGNKADLIEIGKAKQAVTLKQNAKTVLSQNDNTVLSDDHEPDAPFTTVPPKHDTRKHIAKAAGVSTGQVGMAEQLAKKAPALWEKAKAAPSPSYPQSNSPQHGRALPEPQRHVPVRDGAGMAGGMSRHRWQAGWRWDFMPGKRISD
jgi:hypothetical protein